MSDRDVCKAVLIDGQGRWGCVELEGHEGDHHFAQFLARGMAGQEPDCQHPAGHAGPHVWNEQGDAVVPPKQELLEEALRIVTGPRQQLYGRPSQNFIDTANILNAYFQARAITQAGETEVEPYDVAAILICLKLARIATSPGHKDNWVDIAGYAACGWECVVDAELP